MPTKRWIFTDTVAPETWTVPINPREMDSVFPVKSFNVQTVVGTDYARPIVMGGSMPPQPWAFRGAILDAAHHESLRHWVYDKGYRIQIEDHFGRKIHCLLQSFAPTPKRAVGRYWRHEYEVTALVFSVGAPTVGD